MSPQPVQQPDPTTPAPGQAELILRELDALPTLAAAATRLLSITSADDADLSEVIRLIETDPAMTAKVLSLCSRAALGISQPVTTVGRAVVLLGLETVRAAVLSVQVVDWMKRVGDSSRVAAEARSDARGGSGSGGGGGGEYRFDAPGFWRHSIAVACAAELIAKAHQGKSVAPGEAFVAGLVHDLGKPALALALPRAYARVVELAAKRQGNIADFEQQVLGVDHHTAGKRLAERWGLPEGIRDAIWLHGQRPAALPDTESKPVIAIVAIADALCRRLHLGWSGNHLLLPELATLCAEAGLAEAKVEEITPTLAQNLSERCEALGLSNDPGERVLLESVLAANKQLGRLARVMEDRSRSADRRGRVLAAIEEFPGVGPGSSPDSGDSGPVAALEAVVASAVSILGPGRYAGVMQPKDGGQWLLMRFDPDGTPAGHEWIDPPTGANGQRGGLSGLVATINGSGASVGLGAWLAGRLGTDVGAELRMIPLRRPGAPLAGGTGAVAVLVHDRGSSEGELARELAPLVATWSAAVSAAIAHDRTRVLSEQLATSNRELAQMQQKLAEVQSMARLGELTSGAAHEMNSPLAVISGRAQALSARMAEGDDKAAVDAIVVAAHRLSNLLTQLHMIATPPRMRPEPTSLQDVLSLVVRDAKERTASRSVRTPVSTVKVIIAAPIPPIRADKGLLRRALVELVTNALESTPREPVEIRVEPDDTGERLLIRIIDTGGGMSPHALTHAFDPFFSEKPAGRQAGLGLPTARRLVELHGGTILLMSNPGEGTTATVDLRDWRWQDAPAQKLAA